VKKNTVTVYLNKQFHFKQSLHAYAPARIVCLRFKVIVMLTCNSFNINIQSALSENINVKLKAEIICDYLNNCYVINHLEVLNNDSSNIFNNEIKIKPVVQGNEICWVHTHSMRPSILSTAIGKAIEARGNVEMIRRSEAAA